MEVLLKWKYAEGKFDTKTMKLLCIPARGKRVCHPDEIDAELCISDGGNFVIAEIHTGDKDSSNALCEEIVRRFNEFPEELKK
jgi:hypothetical protein